MASHSPGSAEHEKSNTTLISNRHTTHALSYLDKNPFHPDVFTKVYLYHPAPARLYSMERKLQHYPGYINPQIRFFKDPATLHTLNELNNMPYSELLFTKYNQRVSKENMFRKVDRFLTHDGGEVILKLLQEYYGVHFTTVAIDFASLFAELFDDVSSAFKRDGNDDGKFPYLSHISTANTPLLFESAENRTAGRALLSNMKERKKQVMHYVQKIADAYFYRSRFAKWFLSIDQPTWFRGWGIEQRKLFYSSIPEEHRRMVEHFRRYGFVKIPHWEGLPMPYESKNGTGGVDMYFYLFCIISIIWFHY